MELLQANNFEFHFKRLECIGAYVRGFEFPGVSLGNIPIPTPILDYPIPGDKLLYNAFSFEFILSENLYNYKLIHDWMRKEMASLDRERNMVSCSPKDLFEDATLTILTNNKNPIVHIDFRDCFPVDLSGFGMANGDANTVVARATFEYSYFDIRE